jgi:DNA topoisomerase-1
MNLLVVESPSKAKTIGKYLGKDFKVISSYGHVRGLPSETGSVDPDHDFAMKYEINKTSGKQVKIIVDSVKESDAIYLATDPDREGESISWHIVEVLKERKALKKPVPIKRVVFHEITKKAVLNAIDNPRDIDMDLVRAQQTRQALDYLVGFTLSPVLWRKLPGSRSAGRVQSVALRVICDREAEIEKFKTQEYWSLEADFLPEKGGNKFSAKLHTLNGEKLDKFAIANGEQANSIKAELQDKDYQVAKVEKKQAKRNPEPPFTTSTLLQDAARKFGFSAKKTAMLAQKLYEGIDVGGETTGLITYMRTDSVNISEQAIADIREYISGIGKKYLPDQPRLYKTKAKNAQEAHEAIRPTTISRTPEKMRAYLEKDLYNLYDLIWKRTVASQMESAILDVVSIDIKSHDDKAIFRASGSTIAFDGFYHIYIEGKDDEEEVAAEAEKGEQRMPQLTVGQALELLAMACNQHFTQPPARYTEATLVKKLEELGIGRPSTYPTIISILIDREYVILDKKRFLPEARGRIVSAFLHEFFTKYVEYGFTAALEDELDHVASGDANWKKVLADFWKPFKEKTDKVLEFKNTDVIAKLQEALENYIFGTPEGINKKCPDCKDGTLELKTGKFGSFVGCSNYPNCTHTKALSGTAETGEQHEDNNGATTADDLHLPKVLGTDKEGVEISLRKGPYGVYIQLGEGKEAKRRGLPQGKAPKAVDLQYALSLLDLPRIVGKHPETGKEIKASFGRFGPFVEHDGKFTSIRKYDPLTITLEDALAEMEKAASRPARPGRTFKTAGTAKKATGKKKE